MPPRDYVDLAQLKLSPVHYGQRLLSLLYNAFVLAPSDNLTQKAWIIRRRLLAPPRAAWAGWYINGQLITY